MRSDARANRQELLDAAEELVSMHGPKVSLRAVAQQAGVGVGTLYRHFPTRRHLATALLERILGCVDRIVAAYLEDGAAPTPDDGPLTSATARGTAAEDSATPSSAVHSSAADASAADLAAARWHRFATELVGVNLTAAAGALESLESKDLPSEEMIAAAERTLKQRTEDALVRARAEGLVSEDLTGERFFLGLLTVSRPLVPQERWQPPGQEDWMLRTYLRGLRPPQ
jgi:AcrR family transcriptional regulator